MTGLRRAFVLLALLTGAAAGAYAQDALKQEDPSLSDAVQVGVLYSGSTCTDNHNPGYNDFYFRVTRQLRNGWVEADYSTYIAREYGRMTFKPWSKPLRINLTQMCSIQIVTLTE